MRNRVDVELIIKMAGHHIAIRGRRNMAWRWTFRTCIINAYIPRRPARHLTISPSVYKVIDHFRTLLQNVNGTVESGDSENYYVNIIVTLTSAWAERERVSPSLQFYNRRAIASIVNKNHEPRTCVLRAVILISKLYKETHRVWLSLFFS